MLTCKGIPMSRTRASSSVRTFSECTWSGDSARSGAAEYLRTAPDASLCAWKSRRAAERQRSVIAQEMLAWTECKAPCKGQPYMCTAAHSRDHAHQPGNDSSRCARMTPHAPASNFAQCVPGSHSHRIADNGLAANGNRHTATHGAAAHAWRATAHRTPVDSMARRSNAVGIARERGLA